MKKIRLIIQMILIIVSMLVSNNTFARYTKKHHKVQSKSKDFLKLTINKYLKNGFKIYGPYNVDKVENGYAYLFAFSQKHLVIDLLKSKQINEKEENVSIYKGDKVYLLIKKNKNVLLKMKKGATNDY